MKKIYSLLLAAIFYMDSHAQNGPNFINFLQGSNNYYWSSYAVFKQANGNYLSGGALQSGMIAPTNGGLVSVNINGAISWQKYYQDFMPSVMTENGTNIYTLFGNGHSGQGISKHNSTGTVVFAKMYSYNNPNISSQPFGIKIFKEGTNVSFFSTAAYSNGAYVGLVSKIDASGNSVFSKRIDSLSIGDVVQVGSNYIIRGQKSYNSPVSYLMSVDASLNILWSKEIDLTQNISLSYMYVQNNSIYIMGTDNGSRGVLLGFDMSGNLLMSRSYYGTGIDYLQPFYLVYKNNHLFYVSECVTSTGELSDVTELTMTGTVVRDRQINISANGYYNMLALNPDTSVYAIGQAETTPSNYTAFQSHFAVDGDLEMCTPDSMSILDSGLTVNVIPSPGFTVTNEPVTFTNTVLASSTVSSLSVDNFKIVIDSLVGTSPVCGSGCSGDETVYFSGFDQNPSFQWSANAASQTSQTALGLCADVYSVTVTDQFGCTATGTNTLNMALPETPQICLVTDDSADVYNHIIWEKSLYSGVDSFLVYREISTGLYARIGAVSNDSLSEFIDTARSIGAANGDPRVSTYRYKISIKDACGTEGPLSPWHTTIYFNDLHNGSFQWNSYLPENMAVTPITTYELLRDSNNTGYWKVIGTCAGTSNILVDPQYSTFMNTANWRVQANGISCNPTLRSGNNSIQTAIVKTKSNISNNRTTAIKNNFLDGVVELFPNPFSGKFTVTINDKAALSIYNSMGESVYEANITERTTSIDLGHLPHGVYNAVIKNDKGVVVKRVVKQ